MVQKKLTAEGQHQTEQSGQPLSPASKPKRVWLRIAGGGVTLPSGKSYTTLVGDDREAPRHVEYIRADLAADMLKALTLIADEQREDAMPWARSVARAALNSVSEPSS